MSLSSALSPSFVRSPASSSASSSTPSSSPWCPAFLFHFWLGNWLKSLRLNFEIFLSCKNGIANTLGNCGLGFFRAFEPFFGMFDELKVKRNSKRGTGKSSTSFWGIWLTIWRSSAGEIAHGFNSFTHWPRDCGERSRTSDSCLKYSKTYLTELKEK